mmetsp:Transcript_25180/g.54854  ORF Transcript_25180/g.54854 Transcript_25180/m.54854 type:complete len:212 (-) Transcript_25180:923-1558(-)
MGLHPPPASAVLSTRDSWISIPSRKVPSTDFCSMMDPMRFKPHGVLPSKLWRKITDSVPRKRRKTNCKPAGAHRYNEHWLPVVSSSSPPSPGPDFRVCARNSSCKPLAPAASNAGEKNPVWASPASAGSSTWPWSCSLSSCLRVSSCKHHSTCRVDKPDTPAQNPFNRVVSPCKSWMSARLSASTAADLASASRRALCKSSASCSCTCLRS